MAYRHFDITAAQTPKQTGAVCGDVVETLRAADATWVVCADGIGSGIQASVAAHLCASRLMTLVRDGTALRGAFLAVARTMNASRAPGLPYAAFSIARLLPDGGAAVLVYDAPPPLLLAPVGAQPLPLRRFDEDGAVRGEANHRLAPGEALLLMSDGVTEAGRGAGLPRGWGVDGAGRFLSDAVNRGVAPALLPGELCARAEALCGSGPRDDTTAVLVRCRRGVVLNILTGPPVERGRDREVVRRFLAMEGQKVVSGGTTAAVVARVTGGKTEVLPQSMGTLGPPAYRLGGVDLVTEGAVTMNHAFNILDAPPDRLEPHSAVAELCALMRNADRINFIVGRAANAASADIRFRQQHILPRTVIVPMLKERLEEEGRLVVVEYV